MTYVDEKSEALKPITEASTEPDIQENAGRMPDGTFAPGVSGNPLGRPKRKTLTELIHDKLDNTPGAWEELVDVVIRLAKGKDREILKELWHYTDGMPKQKQEITGKDGEPLIVIKHGSTTK